MKKNHFVRIAFSVFVFGAISGLAYFWSYTQSDNTVASPWYSIVPPLLAITMAFTTQKIVLSLFVAMLTGGLLLYVPQSPGSILAWWQGFHQVAAWGADTLSDPLNLQILTVLPIIFSMVEVILKAGGFQGMIHLLTRLIKGPKSAQLMTSLVGLTYSIDDYSNIMIVGSMMRPVTDRFGVSREKLAFLVDSTAAPVAGLAIISTWIGYEVGLFDQIAKQLEIHQDGYSMFFDALPFRFYCVMMILFMFVHILLGWDFGPMKRAQEKALHTPPATEDADGKFDHGSGAMTNHKEHACIAIVPVLGLVVFHITGLFIDGKGLDALRQGGTLWTLAGWRNIVCQTHNSMLILNYAALFGLALAIGLAFAFKAISFPRFIACLREGCKKGLFLCIILSFALTFKDCCTCLGTDKFLIALMGDNLSARYFPALVFVFSSLTSFATGNSWGTMGILIPTAIPVAYVLDGQNYGLITMMCLGAVLDGAIFGDHCSPISDTTIISSIASSCPLMRHIRTQLPYSLFIAALALFCGYLPATFGLSWLGSMGLALLAMLGGYLLWKRFGKSTI